MLKLFLLCLVAVVAKQDDSIAVIRNDDETIQTAEVGAAVGDDGLDNVPVNDEARLVHLLVGRYKNYGFGLARPVEKVEKPLEVSLLWIINEFLGIEELTGQMKVTAVVVATWQDDLLRWNPDKFNQLKAIPMRINDVFLPTIVKEGNGGTQASIFVTGTGQNDRDINSMVWVHHTGRVEARVTNFFATSCNLNLDLFPFDRQTCKFVFKSWRFSDKRVRLHQAASQKSSEHISDSLEVNINANANWMMESIASEDLTIDGGHGENYSAIVYTLNAARRSDYYIWNVILPTVSMAVLLLATFFMPFGPDRSMFCITLVLTMNIFQQALNTKLPVTSEVIPYVRQTTMQVMLGIFITIESAFVWWIAAKDRRSGVPDWMRRLIPILRERIRRAHEKQANMMGHGKASMMAMRHMGTKMDPAELTSMHEANGGDMDATSMPHIMLSRRNSLTSGRSSRRAGDVASVIINGEQFIITGEWIEVAQIVDMLALIIVIVSVFAIPVLCYNVK